MTRGICFNVIAISFPARAFSFNRCCYFLSLTSTTKERCKVPAFEGLVQNKHVALGAPGVRSVTLLQDHDCVPQMVVRKMNLDVGLI